MKAVLVLAALALVVAGCTSPSQTGGATNSTGSGSNAFGEGGGSGSPPSPPPAGSGTGSSSADWHNAANPVVVWTTNQGTFKAELFLDKTPITAGNFLNLTRQGFYDGTRFHRVIPDFMIQDGDPLTKDTSQQNRWGTGGPGYSIRDEFPCKDGSVSYAHQRSTGVKPCTNNGGLFFTHDVKGLLSMANSGPNSGGSQYFVTVAKTDWLDGQHAIFGRVIEGYDVVEKISKVPNSGSPANRPINEVVITSLKVEGS